ncbi:GNAT family N-acetyltransferase [Miniphocaeibacter massiliensis]|uniref:GNAT family N-acetyltransferase n=1 Tax=Miniphocaeibacter massiliensis TaxID=2041841 RepID=UPI001A93A28D|nr:GNAT family N-acetyltransferase [Miniphocaeibacter massiliensis]
MENIRECKIEDAVAIHSINKNEMNYDFSIEETKINIKNLLKSKNEKIFVYEINEKVVGYVHANNYQCTYAPAMKNIMGIAVDSNYKRLRICKKLL